MSKRVVVKCESFMGSIISGGEHIPRCFKNDIITVQDDTWNDMREIMPHKFSLFAEIPQINNVQFKAEVKSNPDIVAEVQSEPAIVAEAPIVESTGMSTTNSFADTPKFGVKRGK